MRTFFAPGLIAFALSFSAPAYADLIRAAQLDQTGGGFGAIPRLLSISNSGQGGTLTAYGTAYSNVYSGCVALAGGVASSGASNCLGTDASIGGNTFINAGGNEANPGAPSQKNNVYTLGSLGVNSLADFVLVFNAIEPQSDSGGINLLDATVKFYSPSGTLLGSIDTANDPSARNFNYTLAGNGNFGFAYVIDGAQQTALSGLFGTTPVSQIRVAVEATVANAQGGEDSFLITSAGGLSEPPTGVPEPSTMIVMGSGLLCLGLCRRSKA